MNNDTEQNANKTLVDMHPVVKEKLFTTLRRGDIEIIVRKGKRTSVWVVKSAVDWKNLFVCCKTEEGTYSIVANKNILAKVSLAEKSKHANAVFWDIVSLMKAIESRQEELTTLRTNKIPQLSKKDMAIIAFLDGRKR